MPDAASSAHAVVVPSCVSVALAGVLSRSRPDANDAVVIELVGEIDVGAVNALARRLAAARDAGHRRVVVT
ncbi:MAG: hypothetical protein WAL63_16850 [Solirubrobacteraceae bacterium]